MKNHFSLASGLCGLVVIVFSFFRVQAANVALNKPTYTSSNYTSAYTGAKAVDGQTTVASKWTSNGSSSTSWLYVDFGSNQSITKVVVKHAGAAGEATYYNTSNFRIETWNGSSWVIKATITNNTASTTTHNFAATSTSRVRLYITDAGIDNYARIPELEAHTSSGCAVTLSTGTSSIGWIYQNSTFTSRTCGPISSGCGSNNWNVTCSSGCGLHIGDDYYADDWIRSNSSGTNISCGENVYAPFAGTILFAGRMTYSYGRTVILRSSQSTGFAFRVAHLQSMNVSTGNTVTQGQLLGKVGNDDGTSNGEGSNFVCHAHAVLYKNITTGNGVTNLSGGHAPSGSVSGSGPSTYAGAYYLDAGCTNKTSDDEMEASIIANEATVPSAEGNLYGLEVYPHPVSGSATLRWNQSEAAEVTIKVINMMGQSVREVSASGVFDSGSQAIDLDASALQSGMYFLIVQDKQGSLVKKITVIQK
jgi:murein DD-endopeptidase MepM/ murein hydrolase activator NlpD